MQGLSILIWIPLAAVNIVAFLFVANDKRRSVHNEQRLPETYFFVWSVFLGAAGVLAGMLILRHKIRKPIFALGVPAALIQNAILVKYILDLL